jgi:hypothetical protein
VTAQLVIHGTDAEARAAFPSESPEDVVHGTGNLRVAALRTLNELAQLHGSHVTLCEAHDYPEERA